MWIHLGIWAQIEGDMGTHTCFSNLCFMLFFKWLKDAHQLELRWLLCGEKLYP